MCFSLSCCKQKHLGGELLNSRSCTYAYLESHLVLLVFSDPSPPSLSVGRLKRQMAEMCVRAVLAVADLERKDVNLDLIKVRG
jgi:hypothetical protein